MKLAQRISKYNSIIFTALLAFVLTNNLRAQKALSGDVKTNALPYVNFGTFEKSNGDISCAIDGRYVIIWTDYVHALNNAPVPTGYVKMRVFNSNGSPLTSDVIVNNNINGDVQARVAMADNGNIGIVYTEVRPYTSSDPRVDMVYYQAYNPSGVPIGSRVFIDYGNCPSIGVAADGSYEISYNAYVIDYSIGGNFNVKRYLPSGSLKETYKVITTNIHNNYTTIKALNGNAFYMAYQTKNYYNANASSVRRYNSSGSMMYAEQQMGNNSIQCLSVKPNGDFVCVDNSPYTKAGIKRSSYNSNSTPNSIEQLANSSGTDFLNKLLSIGMNDNGDYVVLFPKYINNIFQGIFAQQYCVNDAKVGPEYLISNTTINCNQAFLDVSDCSFVVSWTYNGNLYHKRFALYSTTDAGNNVTVNCGSGSVIGGVDCANAPGTTYSWAPSAGLSTTTFLNPIASPTVTTTYTLTTITPRCSRTSEVTVFVNPGPTPVPSFNAKQDVCVDELVSATLSGCQNANQYKWDTYEVDAAGNVIVTLFQGSWNSLNNGIVTNFGYYPPGKKIKLKLTVKNLCSDGVSLEKIVTIRPKPNISVTPQSVGVCAGSTVLITASGGLTYSWSNGETTGTLNYITSSNTILTVIGKDTYGCANTNSVNVSSTPQNIDINISTAIDNNGNKIAYGSTDGEWRVRGVPGTFRTDYATSPSSFSAIPHYSSACSICCYATTPYANWISPKVESSLGCGVYPSTASGTNPLNYFWFEYRFYLPAAFSNIKIELTEIACDNNASIYINPNIFALASTTPNLILSPYIHTMSNFNSLHENWHYTINGTFNAGWNSILVKVENWDAGGDPSLMGLLIRGKVVGSCIPTIPSGFTGGNPTGRIGVTMMEQTNSDNEKRITVSPSPSNGSFTIEIDGADIVETNYIQVYDLLGKMVYEKSNVIESITKVDLTPEPRGIYIVKVVRGDKIELKKIIIQ